VYRASYDPKVRCRLQASHVPQRLYRAIKEDDPIVTGRIIRNLSPKLLGAVMKLVLKLSVGYAEVEREQCAEVLKDLAHLQTIVDAYFIDHVFSSFVHNESRLPISIQLKSFSSRGSNNELQWEPNFDQLSSQKAPKKQQDYTLNFVPSSLLDIEFKKNLIKAFKHFVG